MLPARTARKIGDVYAICGEKIVLGWWSQLLIYTLSFEWCVLEALKIWPLQQQHPSCSLQVADLDEIGLVSEIANNKSVVCRKGLAS